VFTKDEACEEVLAVWGTVQLLTALLQLKSPAYYKPVVRG